MKTTSFEVEAPIRDCSCCSNQEKCKVRTPSADSCPVAKDLQGTLKETSDDALQFSLDVVTKEVQERALKNIHALNMKLRAITDPDREVGNLFAFKRPELSSEEPTTATDTEDTEVQGTVGNLFAFKRKK
jgi:hypothetical protein